MFSTYFFVAISMDNEIKLSIVLYISSQVSIVISTRFLLLFLFLPRITILFQTLLANDSIETRRYWIPNEKLERRITFNRNGMTRDGWPTTHASTLDPNGRFVEIYTSYAPRWADDFRNFRPETDTCASKLEHEQGWVTCRPTAQRP